MLSSSIFNLSTLAIGLFALVGMPPFLINPVLSSFITDRYHPTYSAIIAIMIGIAGVLIGTFVGTFSLAGPIIQGLLVDLCLVMSQTANHAQLPRRRALSQKSRKHGIHCCYILRYANGYCRREPPICIRRVAL
ncbi:hypothetical protein RAB80_000023 [Fusarium oxysporum f. sp. vasinfectum]|nr:hypothetical protein RAB80_000023 [Fusarium oxysporum f. sp. vasinfectum]